MIPFGHAEGREGEAIFEAVNTPHNGKNLGEIPVRLVVFYMGEEGTPITVKNFMKVSSENLYDFFIFPIPCKNPVTSPSSEKTCRLSESPHGLQDRVEPTHRANSTGVKPERLKSTALSHSPETRSTFPAPVKQR